MKAWEQLKDVSYIRIKLTKAKSLSEGISKYKIEKLTRQNPVYEHLKLHKRSSNMICLICDNKHKLIVSPTKARSVNSIPHISHQNNAMAEQFDYARLKNKKHNTVQLIHSKNELNQRIVKIMARTHRENDKKNIMQPKQIVVKEKNLRRTKSNFEKKAVHCLNKKKWFLTEINQIELQSVDEDRNIDYNLSLMQYPIYKESIANQSLQKRIKTIKQPVQFPLTNTQIAQVIQKTKKQNKLNTLKLDKIMSSIYEYKSNVNYRKKRHLISKQVKQ